MSETTEEEIDHGSRPMPKSVKDGMIKVSGKDYLTVPFRLLWMRETCPLWGIATEIMETAGFILVRATVTEETGRVIATGHKACTSGGKFPPIEKAETGAMGRALGAAGFGTQFGELNEEEPGVMGGISDSPIDRRQEAEPQRFRPGQRPAPNMDPDEPGLLAGTINNGTQQCPACYAPPGKNHAPTCKAEFVPSPAETVSVQPNPEQEQKEIKAAMIAFRKTILKFSGQYAAALFPALSMAAWVGEILEMPRNLAEEGYTADEWRQANAILVRFQDRHPAATKAVIEDAVKVRYGTSHKCEQMGGAMWNNVLDEEAVPA